MSLSRSLLIGLRKCWQPATHPWMNTIATINLCRPPTRRGTKAGFGRRIRPITKVPSRWHIAGAVSHIAGEVSHVYKQSGMNISNIIQYLPPPSNPKSASDVNNSVCVPIAATDVLSGTADTSRTRVHDHVHTNLALINTRSVRNKADTIYDYITECDFDVNCLTETWLTENDDAVVDDITPDGYNFRHLPRSDRRGGGVGVMYMASFHVCSRRPYPPSPLGVLKLYCAMCVQRRSHESSRYIGHLHPAGSLRDSGYSSMNSVVFLNVLPRSRLNVSFSVTSTYATAMILPAMLARLISNST